MGRSAINCAREQRKDDGRRADAHKNSLMARTAMQNGPIIGEHILTLKRHLAEELLNVASQTHSWRAARALGIDRARLSDLRRGRVERFSLERLIEMLGIVGRRV